MPEPWMPVSHMPDVEPACIRLLPFAAFLDAAGSGPSVFSPFAHQGMVRTLTAFVASAKGLVKVDWTSGQRKRVRPQPALSEPTRRSGARLIARPASLSFDYEDRVEVTQRTIPASMMVFYCIFQERSDPELETSSGQGEHSARIQSGIRLSGTWYLIRTSVAHGVIQFAYLTVELANTADTRLRRVQSHDSDRAGV